MKMNDKGKELCEIWRQNYYKENDKLGGNSVEGDFVEGWCIIDNYEYIHNLNDECGLWLYGYDENALAEVEDAIERYGEDYHKKFIEKSKQTKLDRYGDADYNNLEKAKQTKLERYGDTNYNNPEKSKQTCLKRYGVSNPMQSKNIQERAKSTNLKRYGVEWGILNKHIRDKNELSRRQFYIKKHDLNGINDEGIWICKCPHLGCNKCEEKQYKISSIQFYGRKQSNIEPCTNLL